jgi:hypothetical protein
VPGNSNSNTRQNPIMNLCFAVHTCSLFIARKILYSCSLSSLSVLLFSPGSYKKRSSGGEEIVLYMVSGCQQSDVFGRAVNDASHFLLLSAWIGFYLSDPSSLVSNNTHVSDSVIFLDSIFLLDGVSLPDSFYRSTTVTNSHSFCLLRSDSVSESFCS